MFFLLKLLISSALIGIAVYILDINMMIETIEKYNWLSFFLAIMINVFIFLILAVRWYKMIRDKSNLSFFNHLFIYLKGTFLNFFTPSNLGGDLYRFFKYKNINKLTLIFLLIKERLIGLYIFLFFYLIAFLYLYFFSEVKIITNNYFLYSFIFSLLLYLIIFMLFVIIRVNLLNIRISNFFKNIIKNKNLYYKFDRYFNYIKEVINIPKLNSLLFLSIISFILLILSFHIISSGLGVYIPIMHIIIVVTVVEIIKFIPITIQGIGLREGVFSFLMALLGHNLEQTYLIGAISYLAISLAIIISGLISLFMEKDKT